MEEAQLAETINFHDALSTIDHRYDLNWRYMGPFKWVVLVSIDEVLLQVFKSFYSCKDTPTFKDEAPRVHMNPLDKTFGLIHQVERKEDHETLRMKLQSTLPSVRVIKMLIDRFFKIAYPYMPVVDEHEFRQSVARLIATGPDADGSPLILGTDQKDPAIYGLLLVILRTAYVTLTGGSNQVPSFCFHNSKEELDYLSIQEIGPDFIGLANYCLSLYNITGDLCIEAFELVVALNYYSTIAPETARYDAKSSALASFLSQIAYSLWMNRELSHDRADFDEKKELLQKKLWYTLVFLEVDRSLYSGNCMSIGPNTFDVKLPEFKPELLNGCDLESEEMAIEHFLLLEDYRELFTEGISLTGRVSGNVKIGRLERVLEKLVKKYDDLLEFLQANRGTLSLKTQDSFRRFTKLRLLLNLHYFLVGIYLHLIFHCTRKGDIPKAREWRYKIIKMFTNFLFPILPDLVNQTMTLVSGSTDVFICGPLIQCLGQCSLSVVSAMVRYNHIQRALENQSNHRALLETSSAYREFFYEVQKHRQLLRSSNLIIVNVFDLMKDKYETARRFSLIGKKVINCQLGPEFVLRDRMMKAHKPELESVRFCNELMEECLEKPGVKELAEELCTTLPTNSTASEIPTELLWESGSLSPFEKYFDIILIEEMTRII